MAIVTEIREVRGVCRVYLDGVFAAGIRKKHFAIRPLQTGDAVDMEKYIDSVAAIQMKDAYEAALCSLDRSAKTAAEIVRGLVQRGYVRPCADAIAEKLMENGLIDDRRYALRIAENNADRAVGVYAMKRRMRAKGISDEDAEEALGTFDEAQQSAAARKAAETLVRKYRSLPVREARGKLSQALARRGFSWEAIREAVDAALDPYDFDEI